MKNAITDNLALFFLRDFDEISLESLTKLFVVTQTINFSDIIESIKSKFIVMKSVEFSNEGE
jgi:hypothetical protein